jgi:hypothetical protein
VESLQDKIKAAKERAMAQQKSKGGGNRDSFWKPEANVEHHFRIIEWYGHDECWIEFPAHFIQGVGGKVVLVACGDDDCYSCGKLQDLTEQGTKEAAEIVRQTKRHDKVIMQMVDWDHRDRGPLLWEPKNTSSCGQWTAFLGIISNPDYMRKVYTFKEGRMLTMLMGQEAKKIGQKQVNMLTLKSLIPGAQNFPLVVGKTKEGMAIQLPQKDGSTKIFKLFDLEEFRLKYDENEHREAWGDEVLEPLEDTTPSGEAAGFEPDQGFEAADPEGLEFAGETQLMPDAGMGSSEFLSFEEPSAAVAPKPTARKATAPRRTK